MSAFAKMIAVPTCKT